MLTMDVLVNAVTHDSTSSVDGAFTSSCTVDVALSSLVRPFCKTTIGHSSHNITKTRQSLH